MLTILDIENSVEKTSSETCSMLDMGGTEFCIYLYSSGLVQICLPRLLRALADAVVADELVPTDVTDDRLVVALSIIREMKQGIGTVMIPGHPFGHCKQGFDNEANSPSNHIAESQNMVSSY